MFLSVNGGPYVDFGCNKAAVEFGNSTNVSGSSAVVIQALPRPYCNVVRIKLVSQLYDNPTQFDTVTSEDAASVADRNKWIFTTLSPYNYKLNLNDNDDGTPTDANMIIDGDGKLFFTIENSGLGCKR